MAQDLLQKQVIEPYHIYLTFFATAFFFALLLNCLNPEGKRIKLKQNKIPNLINKQPRAISNNQTIGKYQFPHINDIPVKKQTLIPKQKFAQKQRQLYNININGTTKFRDPNYYMLQKTKQLQRNIINRTNYSANYMKNQHEILKNYESRKHQIKKGVIRSKKYHQYRPFIEVCRQKIQEQRQRNKWLGMKLRQYLRSLSKKQYSSSSSDPSDPSPEFTFDFNFDNFNQIDKKSVNNLKDFQQDVNYGIIQQQYQSPDQFKNQYEVKMEAKQNYLYYNKPAFWPQEKNQLSFSYQNMAWNVYQNNMNFPYNHFNCNITVYQNNKVEQNHYEHVSQMGSNFKQNKLDMNKSVSFMNSNFQYNNLDMDRSAMGSNVEQNNLDVTKSIIWSEVEIQILPDDF